MQMIKNEKGVTMVALVVTVVILLIIASISINYGLNSIEEAKDNKLKSEISMVQHAVFEEYAKYEIQSKVNKDQALPGIEMQLDDVNKEINDGINLKITSYDDDKESHYYKIVPDENGKMEQLGLEKLVDTYIVNYKTGEAINITTQATSDGNLLYVVK